MILDDPIAHDTACPGCGYNLRGLRCSQRCPECGGPVAGALAGFELVYGDPAWVGLPPGHGERRRPGLFLPILVDILRLPRVRRGASTNRSRWRQA